MDTIFALATAPGKAGLAVVRISGPAAFEACRIMAGRVPAPRRASLMRLRDEDGATLDEALVLVFENGASFTGESVVEFHLHGSVAVIRAVLACLGRIDGLRPADAGEFTRRALANGQLDLTQVEALADLIDSETEAQRIQAAELLSGALGRIAEGWRKGLIRAASLLEATIDFADEEVPVDVSDEVGALLATVRTEIAKELHGLDAAERVRTGFQVAIVGPPNAGKSTLLNHLAGREAAITSDVAGTTRDVIEVRMDIGGLPVTLLDTAGLRKTDDKVEQMGVDRARARADAADLRIHLVVDGAVPELAVRPGDLVLKAKADADIDGSGVSGLTGAGVPALIAGVRGLLEGKVAGAGLASRERHRVALTEAKAHLDAATRLLDHGPDRYDLTSEELRFALRRLEALIGRVDVEQVLGDIFASFCVGK